jgi:hypothetical protein
VFQLLPLTWLGLFRARHGLLVGFSYIHDVAGPWFLFPCTHNGATMFAPIAFACWLFGYYGLLISVVLNGLFFQIVSILLLRGLLPNADFVEEAIIGLTTSLLIGFVVCWLRKAIDETQKARRQVQESESARAFIEWREKQAILAYERDHEVSEIKEQYTLGNICTKRHNWVFGVWRKRFASGLISSIFVTSCFM